jgi:monofunctional biosynthetic peptidoglycan transglycosylase
MSPEPPQEPEEEAVPESEEPGEAESTLPEPEPEPEAEADAQIEPEPVPEPPVVAPPPPPPSDYRPPWPPERPASAPPPKLATRRPGGFGRLVRAVFIWGFLLTVALPVGATVLFRFVPPPVTILMVQRLFQGKGLDYRWRSINHISPALVQAAIASEDAKFCAHHGFDFEAMEKAMAANKRRPNRIRGGSTISQQTAKNVFLWPQRSYLRKGLEAYYTVLIETLWGKRRIMEVYLNVAEMGAGTYGAEAAAQRYFGVSADRLTRAQAARLVAILPNPLKYKAVNPGRYVAKRSRRIGAAAGTVRSDGLSACVGHLRPATRAERDEPEPARRPAARQPAPERQTDPLPPVEAAPPPVVVEPTPTAEPPAEPAPGFATSD